MTTLVPLRPADPPDPNPDLVAMLEDALARVMMGEVTDCIERLGACTYAQQMSMSRNG